LLFVKRLVCNANATPKGTRHPDFAFKNFVMCPQCNKPLLGSSSRGKTGQYYSYYHCDKRGHKFRVKKEELELRVLEFVGDLEFSQQDIDTLFVAIKAAYDKRLAYYDAQISMIDSIRSPASTSKLAAWLKTSLPLLLQLNST
jgi:hypothetical protein